MNVQLTGLKPFLCSTIDKALLRHEWEKWRRSLQIGLDAMEITNPEKRRTQLLFWGGVDLQEVYYNLPDAHEEYDPKKKNDVYKTAIEKLDEYFMPIRNTTFERHQFWSMKPNEDEKARQFLIRLRHQASKCYFGKTAEEVVDINLKDRLIATCASESFKKKLMEKERTLKDVIDLFEVEDQLGKKSESLRSEGTEKVNRVESGRDTGRRENSSKDCFRCGSTNHEGTDKGCPAMKMRCNKCQFVGHFSKKCRTRKRMSTTEANKSDANDNPGSVKRFKANPKKKKKQAVNLVDAETVESDDDSISSDKQLSDYCFSVDSSKTMETIDCEIGGRVIKMIIDSGCLVNLIGEKDWQNLQDSGAKIFNVSRSVDRVFRSYASSTLLKVVAGFDAEVKLRNGKQICSTFYVIQNGGVSLMGKISAMDLGVLKIGLDVNQVAAQAENFPKIKDVSIDLVIDHRVKPVQQPYRRTPLALEEKINQKIDELVKADIVEPVQGSSRWISPIVPIIKDNGDLRLCIDMRRANQAILREQYPLPTIENYLHRLADARLFSRLDIKNAFHQLELDKRCRFITTFISRRGLFRYKRLMFGINAAPEIFQRTMENLLVNCKNCLNYIDDIIVFGRDVKEHDECLKKVLKVLRESNVLLNEEKCVYRVKQLIFLGHHLSEKGIRPLKEKIRAIRAFREPKSREELRSFLGLVTYIGRFIPNLATKTDTLRSLLKGEKVFSWKEEHKLAFRRLLEVIGDIRTLGYYDPKDRTQVIADASPVGLGAVLIQFKGETPRIISYASKSLTETEKRYCQTEKEALSLVWAVEKFYIFLCGIEFDLITDHKALETIFKPSSKPCARIERWVLRLQSFKYRVVYKSGKMNIADSLSRLGLPTDAEPFDEEGEYYIRSVVQIAVPTALSLEEIKEESKNDQELLDLKQALETNDWKNQDIKQYIPFRQEISAVDDVLLRGVKIIIPRNLRKRVLEIAHEGHPGESLMKRRIRTKVWWPKIDRMVERHVKSCRSCVLVSQPLNPAPMTRKSLPDAPWVDIAIDFLGPLPTGEYLLVVVDYYSRYQEIEVMDRITSRDTINRLEKIFCRLGFPKTISLDNGKQFVSREFTHYCKSNGIKLNSVAPYWPQANGEVERQNRSILKRLKISHLEERDWRRDLLAYLAMYYNTPHSVTGKSPAELFYGRLLRDKIPLVTEASLNDDEEVRDCDMEKKERGKELEDKQRRAKDHDISEGDSVFVKNQSCSDKLSPTFLPEEFIIMERRGNTVTMRGKESGKIFKRNIAHIKPVPRVEKLFLKRQGEVWEPM